MEQLIGRLEKGDGEGEGDGTGSASGSGICLMAEDLYLREEIRENEK